MNYKKVMSLLLFFMLYIPTVYSQPTFNCILKNDAVVSGKVYEVDVYMFSTTSAPIELAAIAEGFRINNAALNSGVVTASWVPGTSELSNSSQTPTQFNCSTISGNNRITKIAGKIPPGSGNGSMISNIAPGTRIGRLRLTNSVQFSSTQLNLAWLMDLPYPTSVNAYINGINTDITEYGTFTTALLNPILPVEISTFSSNVNGRKVILNWETKTEANSNKFDIDRASVNTKSAALVWINVGSVSASGNSISSKKYSFTETELQGGKYQYRLKMIDVNGSYKYSSIVEAEIALPKEFSVSQNYPNPFNPTTKIDYQIPAEAQISMEVYNITGQKVKDVINQIQDAGYYSVNFGSSSIKLPSGVYIYRLNATEQASGKRYSIIKKMMLLK